MAEGRVIEGANSADNTKLGTNVMPKGMTYEELLAGYQRLHHRLFADRGIATRIRNKLAHLKHPPGNRHSFAESLGILRRLLVHGLLPGGPGRLLRFLGSLPYLRPRLLAQTVEDWIVGLAMRDYVDRHFKPLTERSLAPGYFAALEQAFRRYREEGAIDLALTDVRNRAAELSLRLRGRLDRSFFKRAARHLERALRDSTSVVALHIDALHETELPHLERLLRRLSRHGDRIRITVHEKLQGMIRVDSSVFHLSLGAGR
jgi:hypothetical protein